MRGTILKNIYVVGPSTHQSSTVVFFSCSFKKSPPRVFGATCFCAHVFAVVFYPCIIARRAAFAVAFLLFAFAFFFPFAFAFPFPFTFAFALPFDFGDSGEPGSSSSSSSSSS
eukprot:GEMP01060982.1.p1 GENE.GEMP01060982.1~~GEMP01060982.1.p1  ORF type:complete len:113 (-),score=3.05 GEMP01060982.1:112-450(-)